MKVIETPLPGVRVIEPTVYGDARGFFLEVHRESVYRAHGIPARFVQDNQSRSRRGTVRGLHYQLRQAQAKLCRVAAGAVLDVVVDIRRESPAFGQSFAVELSAANHRQLYVPRGLAHGFAVLSESADFLYKCDNEYAPDDEYGVRWDDPALGIDWGVDAPLLSDRDRALPCLDAIPADCLPVYTP
jgi:dTDP-4-dehydrorhamnose 3,5-epimerase